MRRIAFVLLFLCGCKVMPPKPPLVESIAILPFDSESNDLNAPDILQKLTYMALKNSVYKPLDIAFVNDKLAKVGIVDGGQLAIVDPVKLGKDLGVQALLYGYNENFDYTNVGFYLQRRVTLNLKLVDVSNGAVLWENAGKGVHRELNLEKDKAANAFVKGIADQSIEKLFDTPLEDEARVSVITALRSLPGFSFCGFANDDKGFKRGASGVLKDVIRKK